MWSCLPYTGVTGWLAFLPDLLKIIWSVLILGIFLLLPWDCTVMCKRRVDMSWMACSFMEALQNPLYLPAPSGLERSQRVRHQLGNPKRNYSRAVMAWPVYCAGPQTQSNRQTLKTTILLLEIFAVEFYVLTLESICCVSLQRKIVLGGFRIG